MKTKIFAYKGTIGADTDTENGVFINDPTSPGQLGVVISVNEIEITQEAVDLLKNAPREGGSFAPIMLTKHEGAAPEHGLASIGLMGFGKHLFMGEDVCIGRTCDTSILDLCEIVELEIPSQFKEIIDS